MKTAALILLGLLCCGAALTTWVVADDASEQEAIRKADAAYVEAYNRRDAKALAALWSEKAEYVNPDSGKKVKGREAIEKEFATIFESRGEGKLELLPSTIRLVTADVAIEDGAVNVIRAGEQPEESTYTAVFVKKDGKWLLDSVRETDVPLPDSHYDELKDLEWLIGEWHDTSEEAEAHTTFEWTKNRNFIKMTFTVSIGDRLDMEGTQYIGWDPAQGRVRSWMFDSDGGFAEGVWVLRGDRCTVNSASTLPDGRQASSVNVYTRQGDSAFSWESTGREVDGEIMPNVGPITVVRKPAKTTK